MKEVIKCRLKSERVEALRVSPGTHLSSVRDFLTLCNNIVVPEYFITRKLDEPLTLDSDEGKLLISPGDFIVVDESRHAKIFSPEEFEDKYELEVNPRELHYVITKYGFSIEDAEFMLRDEKVRAILIAPLLEETKAKRKGSGPTNITVNPYVSPTVNAESISKSISASISNSLTNHSY